MALRGRYIFSILAILVLITSFGAGTFSIHSAEASTAIPVSSSSAPVAGTAVCGQKILDAPWNYSGAAGTYTVSGSPAGLPTFGAAGTNFPSATSLIVVPTGDNTAAADTGEYNVDNTVVYFEPGEHDVKNGMYTGHDSAYVGGYTKATGKAIINGVDGATNGTGLGGTVLAYSTPSSGNDVVDTWEYLTIENYTSSRNSSVMGEVNGGSSDIGDTYEYDTIGPNEYGYDGNSNPPATDQNSGGGYAIDAGSNTTIEHNCLVHNAQGAFNVSNSVNLVIDHNEISWNGIGEYPDTGTSSGQSTHSCGCSGGGKIFFSLNADVVANYIHDNYNAGVWFDFDNSGSNISHNYIASNWGPGIMYEASYNADISDNTLTGNGWASDGAWPAGVNGGSCYGGISCTNGGGPVTGAGGGNSYAVIDLSNSGGNSKLADVSVSSSVSPLCTTVCTEKSRYAGHLTVSGNTLINNFGGVKVYTDTNRYPGNIDNDSACSIPLGVLDQDNNTTYYKQGSILDTGSDSAISGSSVTTAGGTQTICNNYGQSVDASSDVTSQAPSVGMAAYDENTGKFLGNVVSVTSANAFTLSKSPGDETGASLLLSAYGGCGPADYYHGAPGVKSGTPKAYYWDNCNWGSRNVSVTGNTFSSDTSVITDCTVTANRCGFMDAVAFNAGVPVLMGYWDNYTTQLAAATGGLGNVWHDNTYTGTWQFEAGSQGNQVTQSQWQASPYGQDSGSSFS
jgi:parallel beta-helix repeat protein